MSPNFGMISKILSMLPSRCTTRNKKILFLLTTEYCSADVCTCHFFSPDKPIFFTVFSTFLQAFFTHQILTGYKNFEKNFHLLYISK